MGFLGLSFCLQTRFQSPCRGSTQPLADPALPWVFSASTLWTWTWRGLWLTITGIFKPSQKCLQILSKFNSHSIPAGGGVSIPGLVHGGDTKAPRAASQSCTARSGQSGVWMQGSVISEPASVPLGHTEPFLARFWQGGAGQRQVRISHRHRKCRQQDTCCCSAIFFKNQN